MMLFCTCHASSWSRRTSSACSSRCRLASPSRSDGAWRMHTDGYAGAVCRWRRPAMAQRQKSDVSDMTGMCNKAYKPSRVSTSLSAGCCCVPGVIIVREPRINDMQHNT